MSLVAKETLMALLSLATLVIILAIIVNFFVSMLTNTSTFNKFRKYILLILAVFYPIYCLVHIKVSIRWGGDSQQSYASGLRDAAISLVIPIVFSIIKARFTNDPTKENFMAAFLRILPTVLLVCSVLLSIFYFFMMSVHF